MANTGQQTVYHSLCRPQDRTALIVGHAALRSWFSLIETQIWVQFGSNLGPIRISNDCFALTSALFGVAKLLKIRSSAFSQRGGQRFDPAQLHQGINYLRRNLAKDSSS